MRKTSRKRTSSVDVFPESVQDAMAEIRGKFGEDAVVSGEDLAQPHLRKFPFDIFALDAAIGGGVPRGRISLLWSKEFSAGKSTLALKVAASCQKRCRFCDHRISFRKSGAGTIHVKKPCKCGKNQPGVVVYADIEHTFDAAYARALGFDPDLALIIQPEYAEKGIDIMNAMLAADGVDLLICDSMAALTPTVEAEDGAGKWQQGLQARLNNKWMRAIVSAMNSLGASNDQKPAVILLNQGREKIGIMWGDPNTIPGGKGQKFAASVTIELTGSSVLRVNEKGQEVQKEGEVIGRTILWNVRKNKITGRMGMNGEFKLYNITNDRLNVKLGGVNNDEQILGFAKLFGLVEGAYSYGDVKGHGAVNFIAAAKEAKVWVKLKKEVANILVVSTTVAEEET